MPQAQTLDIRIQTSDKKGFTLVELMVAVSIIGILAAVGVVIFSASTRDAQNTKRVQDLVAISHALELYKSLHGHYPNTPVIGTFQRVDNAIGVSPPASATNALVPQFMAQMPCDPVGSFCYQYISNSTGTEYKITTDPGLPSSGRITMTDLRKQASIIDPASYVGYAVTDPCMADHAGTPRGFAVFTPGGCTFINSYTSYSSSPPPPGPPPPGPPPPGPPPPGPPPPPPSSGGTFGTTTPGPLVDTSDSNFINCGRFTSPASAVTAISMSVHVATIDSSAANRSYQMAIYSDAAGRPSARIASTGSGTLTANSWNTTSVTANLTASTPYWFCYNSNGRTSAVNNMHYSNGGTSAYSSSPVTYGTWPATFPASTLDVLNYSIYASY